MSSSRDPTPRAQGAPADVALLASFLDGSLSAADEASLLRRLSQDPALADLLDTLAAEMADELAGSSPDSAVEAEAFAAFARHAEAQAPELDSVLETVLAGLPAEHLPPTADAARALGFLAADGALSDAQQRALSTLIDADDTLAAEAEQALAFVDASQALLPAVGELPALQRTFAQLPDFIEARVMRTERGWALCTAAADGALSAHEAQEFAGLCGADDDLLAQAEAHVRATPYIAEAFRAFAESPQVAGLAQRAGDAALQVIAAEAHQAADARRLEAQQASKTDQAGAGVQAATPSLWDRLVGAFRQGVAPIAAATAAAAAFVIIGSNAGPATLHGGPSSESERTLAEVRNALFDGLQPVVMAQNTVLPNADDLPVLEDNAADVEAIDATSTTMVFQTAESNITVIWVAGLDDSDADDDTDDGRAPDSAQEQGT